MQRTQLHADPSGIFLHDAILAACTKFSEKTAVVDTSCAGQPGRISYSEYGDLVETAARNLTALGVKPGEVIAIFLPNCWEYAVAYHAATLAGAIPTLVNPSYRERELRYQLENSGAVMLISDAPLLPTLGSERVGGLRHVFAIRAHYPGAAPFSDLLKASTAALPAAQSSSESTLAALPYSSGTTGLPKGVMLSHLNLVANVYQLFAPGEAATPNSNDITLDFLPLYHIYGLNVVLNPTLMSGGTLVMMPRFDPQRAMELLVSEGVTLLPLVPPVMSCFITAAQQGHFPVKHQVRACKSGAAPLAPELPRRFTELTGIRVRQGYGMTEASPVTHLGFIEEDLYKPESIGMPVALTDCRLIDDAGADVPRGERGELMMRGPQFMSGYWKSQDATREVLRDGWYYSGDVASIDERGFYTIVDRRKEMIKYKGFAIAPAEVEAVLLEHPAVQDCGVVGRKDPAAGEIPVAFVVLRSSFDQCAKTSDALCAHVGENLSSYKQPREVRFVEAIPRNPSGKILRKDLRAQL
jgi:long-chain acyl-CoA synthetase